MDFNSKKIKDFRHLLIRIAITINIMTHMISEAVILIKQEFPLLNH
jgi:hypothetical protein